MKKQFIFAAVIAILFISCTGFFDMREDVKVTDHSEKDQYGNVISTTHVRFDNRTRLFPVDVFSSSTRDFKINQNIIAAGQLTGEIPWVPTKAGDLFFFYLTYYMSIEGLQIPFVMNSYGVGSISRSIPFNETTTVVIHDIASIVPADTYLTSDVYIIIDNNFTTSVQLERGQGGVNSIIVPENYTGSNYAINPGSKGLYKVTPAASTGSYSINVNVPRNLPPEITSLAAGNIYIIDFNSSGIPAFKGSRRLTMSSFVN